MDTARFIEEWKKSVFQPHESHDLYIGRVNNVYYMRWNGVPFCRVHDKAHVHEDAIRLSSVPDDVNWEEWSIIVLKNAYIGEVKFGPESGDEVEEISHIEYDDAI